MSSTFLFVNLMLLSVSLGLLVHYWIEKKLIRGFAICWTGSSKEPLEIVLALAGVIYKTQKEMSWRSSQAFIPVPLFSSLGMTPGSILQKGGCCSDRTRLTIVSLHALGFKAGSITVCLPSGAAQHCLVEVSLPTGNVLIDPTYGLHYVDEQGRVIGLPDLQAGTRPSFVSLPGSTARSYPLGSYYEFDYSKTKTANWTQARFRKAIYRVLYLATAGAIDRIKQPVILEWPQLVLATSITILLLSMNVAILVLG